MDRRNVLWIGLREVPALTLGERVGLGDRLPDHDATGAGRRLDEERNASAIDRDRGIAGLAGEMLNDAATIRPRRRQRFPDLECGARQFRNESTVQCRRRLAVDPDERIVE
jgi:hypothetical protein